MGNLLNYMNEIGLKRTNEIVELYWNKNDQTFGDLLLQF